MIDRETFEVWMQEMDDHFPGERSERILAVYWRELSRRVETEEFEAACVEILGDREFFPPWRAFIASDNVADRAAEQWDLCQQIMSNKRKADQIMEQMTPEGRRVVRAMGGPRELCRTGVDEVSWRRKEFLKLYGTASEAAQRDRLPPMTEDGRELIEAATRGDLEAPQ